MSGKIFTAENKSTNGWLGTDTSITYLDLKLKELDVKNKAQEISMRKVYASIIFAFVFLYMIAVFVIIFMSGFNNSFDMDNSILITLLGTTTANVLGLFAIVVNYIFPKK